MDNNSSEKLLKEQNITEDQHHSETMVDLVLGPQEKGSKAIRIQLDVYNRLKELAVPFKETPSMIISQLLDYHANSRRSEGENEQVHVTSIMKG